MPFQAVNDRQYLEKQYQDSANLEVRIDLHRRFSVNDYGWFRWVFDHFDLPPLARVLELGCGPGTLWLKNFSRIPAGWEVTLSDASAGMVQQAQRNLERKRAFQYKVIDARSIPLDDQSFEAVIADHMLYHVSDRPAALAEIHRILKPGGGLFASTVGERHLAEMRDLIQKYDPSLHTWEGFGRDTASFTLENGSGQLSPWFANINIYRYEDALEVTESGPLVDYLLSGREYIPRARQPQFRKFVKGELASRTGAFHITKDSGLFVATRKECEA